MSWSSHLAIEFQFSISQNSISQVDFLDVMVTDVIRLIKNSDRKASQKTLIQDLQMMCAQFVIRYKNVPGKKNDTI